MNARKIANLSTNRRTDLLVQAEPGVSVQALIPLLKRALPRTEVFSTGDLSRVAKLYYLENTCIGVSFFFSTAIGILIGFTMLAGLSVGHPGHGPARIPPVDGAGHPRGSDADPQPIRRPCLREGAGRHFRVRGLEGEPMGKAYFASASRTLRPKEVRTEDPQERLSANYQEAVLRFEPDQPGLPDRPARSGPPGGEMKTAASSRRFRGFDRR